MESINAETHLTTAWS